MAVMFALMFTGCGGVSRADIAAELGRRLARATPPASVHKEHWRAVRQMYAERDTAPRWLEGNRPNANARQLVDAVATADREGLRASDYDLDELADALRRTYDSGGVTAGKLADLDLRLTGLYLDYGADLLTGRVDPAVINDGFLVRTRRREADSILVATAGARDFSAMLTELRPRSEQYQALLKVLGRYRELADSGGWKPVPGGAIRPGERSGRIVLLRRHLAMTGDLQQASGDSLFDSVLQAAVDRFRARHDLPRAGGVDGATLAELNVPAAERLRQVELNLDRLRWVPNDFGARYVLVNIPEYQLHAFDGGREVLGMRVVVGKDYEHATPVFADTMTEVVFHPDWNVPASITLKEIWPAAKEDKDYLEDHGYVVVDRKHPDVPLDPGDVDWDADTTDFPYLIRQGPGERNALGNIKFLFPNRFAVYMHATPAQDLFRLRDRAASHGCVRLERPEAFARYVLAPEQGWDSVRIHDALADTAQVSVHLSRGLPVYLLYLTAFVHDGQVQFRRDVYGSDRRAIRGFRPAARDSVIEPLRRRLDQLMRG
jgi:murein L,D-transpeptidase YcbB/YkuD